MSEFSFEKFPEYVWVVAEPNEQGLYKIHAKVHPSGKFKTYPGEMELREMFGHLQEMQVLLGLPDEAVIIATNEQVLNKPDVLHHKLKKFVKGAKP